MALAKGSELHCSPCDTYYAKHFILRMPMSINGEPAKIIPASRELFLTEECHNLSLYSIISEVEAALKNYGVSHVISLWCDDVPYLQVDKRSC